MPLSRLALLLPPLLIAAPPSRPPAAPGAAPAAGPEVRAQGFRVAVERIAQQQNLALDFTGGATVAEPSGKQTVYLYLAVHPPAPGQVGQIEGLAGQLSATTPDGGLMGLQTYSAEEVSPLTTGVWRTLLMVSEYPLDAGRIRQLKGELVVYPRSELVTLEFPPPGPNPIVRERAGFRASVKQGRSRSGSLSVVVSTEWPEGHSIARPNPEAPHGVVAFSKGGTVHYPYGGVSNTTTTNGVSSREYTLTFTDLKEAPAKLKVEVLVRSGVPRRLPFAFSDLRLPDTLDLALETDDEGPDDAPLAAGHPLHDPKGGILTLAGGSSVSAGKEAGRLLLGLSRKEGSGYGPWRWLELEADRAGTVTLARLRPGTYRVVRTWLPAGSAAPSHPSVPPASVPVEVRIVAGQNTVLPAAPEMRP